MAQTARARAQRLAPAGADLVGLGATAALVSDRPRRGEHRFHIAFANAAGVAHSTGVLAKGRRDRAAEEDLVSRAIVLMLAGACGVAAPSPQSLLDADEDYAQTVVAEGAAVDTIDRLLAGEHDRVTVQPDGQIMLSAPPPTVLFPGSFNPMHAGHRLLARVAEELRQQPLAFEISVTNVDKPPLLGETVRNRLAQFAWKSPVELTRAPTFLEKSRLFPKTIFVIGADTAERLVAPKYYGDDELLMQGALEEIANSGSSFLVAVRLDAGAACARSPTSRCRGATPISSPKSPSTGSASTPPHPRFAPGDAQMGDAQMGDGKLVIYSAPAPPPEIAAPADATASNPTFEQYRQRASSSILCHGYEDRGLRQVGAAGACRCVFGGGLLAQM